MRGKRRDREAALQSPARLRRRGALPAERCRSSSKWRRMPTMRCSTAAMAEKLEQYGPYRIVRPEGQAIWQKALPATEWDSADAMFTGDTDEEGMGRWRFPKAPLGETWPMKHDGIDYLGRFTSFRHVGVFPEQASHWDHMAGADRSGGAAGQGAQPVRLYRPCLAGGGARRRRGHPCRRLEEGDRLGAREPGDGRAWRQADPLDLRGRDEIRRARGAARQPLRHHPVRPAGLWPRAEGRGLAVVRGPAGADRHLPRDPDAEAAGRGADRLFDPGLVLRHPCADARHLRRHGRHGRNRANWSSAKSRPAGRCRPRCFRAGWRA